MKTADYLTPTASLGLRLSNCRKEFCPASCVRASAGRAIHETPIGQGWGFHDRRGWSGPISKSLLTCELEDPFSRRVSFDAADSPSNWSFANAGASRRVGARCRPGPLRRAASGPPRPGRRRPVERQQCGVTHRRPGQVRYCCRFLGGHTGGGSAGQADDRGQSGHVGRCRAALDDLGEQGTGDRAVADFGGRNAVGAE